MNERTYAVVRRDGMDALTRSLGYVDAERLISLMIREPFDYTKWRQGHLKNDDIRTLSRNAMDYSKNDAT